MWIPDQVRDDYDGGKLMPKFVAATVREVLEEREGLQKVRVDRVDRGNGDRAYVLTNVIGTVAAGDDVIINTTAVELELGTGGWHVVHWNLSRDQFENSGVGNGMKVRYTSAQIDVGSAEESRDAASNLEGLPVVACFLLSQAAVAALAIKRERPDAKVALIVTDQASLPIAFSDLIFDLRQKQWIDVVYTCGQAFGGDVEAVNVASALCMAKAQGVDVAIVSEGPGVVGTATTYGFSSFEMAGVVDLAQKLGAKALVAVRYSGADERARHRGVSHHVKTVLANCKNATVAIPAGEPALDNDAHECVSVDVGDVEMLVKESDVEITSMRRGFSDDPKFFRYAAAAGVAAARS